MYLLIAICVIVAAGLLADALRRLSLVIVFYENVSVAKKTMRLHMFIVIFHSITFFGGNMTVTTSFLFPNNTDYAIWDSAKLAMFFTQSIS